MTKSKDKKNDIMKYYRKGKLWRKALWLTVLSAL